MSKNTSKIAPKDCETLGATVLDSKVVFRLETLSIKSINVI